jgi:hypothetical protein
MKKIQMNMTAVLATDEGVQTIQRLRQLQERFDSQQVRWSSQAAASGSSAKRG